MSDILRARYDKYLSGDVRIDGSTFSLLAIPNEHHEIHDGSFFSILTYSDNLDNNATINISLLTPNTTTECHIIWLFDSSGEFTIEVLSGSTVVDGTPATALNNNRRSAVTSVMTCKTGVTVSADGNTIYRRYVTSGKNVGAPVRGNDERVLAANTQYVFRLTSKNAGSKAHIELSWYEHIAKTIYGT